MGREDETTDCGDGLEKIMERFDAESQAPKKRRLSEWIAENKALLVAGGSIAVGAGKAVAWIIEHIDDINRFFETATSSFQLESGTRVVDFDALKVEGVPLVEVLGFDEVLAKEISQKLIDATDAGKVVSGRMGFTIEP